MGVCGAPVVCRPDVGPFVVRPEPLEAGRGATGAPLRTLAVEFAPVADAAEPERVAALSGGVSSMPGGCGAGAASELECARSSRSGSPEPPNACDTPIAVATTSSTLRKAARRARRRRQIEPPDPVPAVVHSPAPAAIHSVATPTAHSRARSAPQSLGYPPGASSLGCPRGASGASDAGPALPVVARSGTSVVARSGTSGAARSGTSGAAGPAAFARAAALARRENPGAGSQPPMRSWRSWRSVGRSLVSTPSPGCATRRRDEAASRL